MRLNGIDSGFDLNCVNSVVGSEIIGQSFDVQMHRALTESLFRHLTENVGGPPGCGREGLWA